MQEKILIKDSFGSNFSAILSIPCNKKSEKLVILCHGLNSSKDSSTNLALEEKFNKLGISALRFDFFAHGESEGKLEERAVSRFVDDIVHSAKFVKNKGFTKLGLCGSSFGGLSAVIATTKIPNVKVMALKAPGMGQNSRTLPNYSADFKKKTWIEAGKKVKVPTLIIHGTADEDVETIYGQELAKNIKNSTLSLYKGANHKFTNKQDFDKSIEETVQFISKYL